MIELEYRGYRIEATSYRAREPDGWMARALVWWDEGGATHHVPLLDNRSRRFGTQDEADALAVQLARVWIDERG